MNRQAIARYVAFSFRASKTNSRRRCPSLDVTLQFAHCRCGAAPISVLESEEFPRVKKLVLYLGKHDPEETHLRRQDDCTPSAKFFRPLVSGMSFPDLKVLEVRHYWATIPPAGASLEIEDQCDASDSYSDCYDVIGHSDGLKKLESIMLESPPELNSAVLMQLVGNPKAVASNLTALDLRFCQLDQTTLAQLLYHAPPNIKRLSLFCGLHNAGNHGYHRQRLYGRRPIMSRVNNGTINPKQDSDDTHLCPLIRQVSTRLERLEYGATQVCRQLFFDDDEIHSLREDGITTKIGGNGGQSTESEKLDTHAIEKTVRAMRKRKRTITLEARVRERLDELNSSDHPLDPHSVFGASSKPANRESNIRRELESLLDEEEAQRQRLIHRSSRRWSRRIITWESLCGFGDTWEEMKLAAGLGEQGVEWVLASKSTTYACPIVTRLANRPTRQGASRRKPAYQRRAGHRTRLRAGSGRKV